MALQGRQGSGQAEDRNRGRVSLRAPRFSAHLGALAERLSVLRLEHLAPDREARLGRLVAETVAWRRRDKDPVSVLRAASTGSLADEVELAVLEAVDRAVRSSSAVECVNAIYRNLHQFGRGSVREGKTPAELAGIELPASDWLQLPGLAAEEEPVAQSSKAAPPPPRQPPPGQQQPPEPTGCARLTQQHNMP